MAIASPTASDSRSPSPVSAASIESPRSASPQAENPLKGRISKNFESALTVRVKRALSFVVQCLALIFSLATFTLFKKFSDYLFPDILKLRIEKKRIDSLDPALEKGRKIDKKEWLKNYSGTNKNKAEAFIDRVIAIRQTIKQLPYDVKIGSVEKEVYNPLNALVQENFFQELPGDDPVRQFIESVGYQLGSTDGQAVLDYHVRQVLGPVKETGNYGQLAEVADNYLSEVGFKRDNLVETISWGMHNRTSANQSRRAKKDDYNANLNNPTLIGHEFVRKGKKIPLVYGPAITPGDHLYEQAVVPALQGNGEKELRLDYLDEDAGNEKWMIEKADEVAEKSNGTVEHIHVGFDEKKKLAKEETTLDNLLKRYVGRMRLDQEKNTFAHHVPEEHFNEAVKIIKELFEGVEIDARTNRLILHTLDAFLTLGMIETTDATRIHSNCRQGIDRGAVKNAILLLLDHLKTGEPLTEGAIYHILSPMLARSNIVEGRNILLKRYQIFHDFAIAVGQAEDRFRKAINNYLDFVNPPAKAPLPVA
ncbi:MAG TPA: hypothetical protein VLE89_03255 [Chlamydiales bacterium]|nr:hypothetical protein [Chlamydiales bacterium]